MPVVAIPEVGDVEFPDTMSEQDISTAIERDILPGRKSPSQNADTTLEELNREMAPYASLLQPADVPLPIPLPRVAPGDNAGTVSKAAAVVANTAIAAAEGMLHPATPAIAVAGLVAPEVVAPVLTATMAKSGAQSLAEGITDLEQGRVNAGVRNLGDASANLLLAASPAAKPSLFSGRPVVDSALSRTVSEQKSQPVVAPVEIDPAIKESVSLPDSSRISEAIGRQDVMPGRDWIASPEFEFRNIPEAAPLVTAAVEAELGYRSQVSRDIQGFDALKSSLTKEQQLKVTAALRSKQLGDPSLLEGLSPEEQKIASGIRSYFEDVRQKIIGSKKQDLIETLPGARQSALESILDGTDAEVAFKDNKLRESGKQAVRDALSELNDLNQWGIEDYVTNIERGAYRVVTEDGTTVAVAQTRSGAKAKALQYIQDNPETSSLTLTDEFNPGIEFPTKLSRGQYYRMIGKLSDALEKDSKTIQDALRSEGAVVTIKPATKYSAPLQQRKGILKGEENLFDALPVYAYSVNKKLALDPVFKQARTILPKLPENARGQIEELLGDIRGRYTLADRLVDHVLSPLGTKPFAFSRGVNVARAITANLKLGYRPITALINRLSGLQHTWTKTGTAAWLQGREFLKTPEFKALWEQNRDFVGSEAQAFVEGGKPKEASPWGPLGMFQFAEKSNRPEAFAAFYKYAENKLGFPPEQSAVYARGMTRFAQFTYNTASIPRILRGPVGRLVGQFKPYLVKELEFLSTLRGGEIPRYISGFLALGGPRAAIYMLRSLPVLGALGLFSWLEAELNRKAPSASRGIGGLAGVDITAAVTPQLPSRTEDWLGPTVADIYHLYDSVLRPVMQGERRDLTDVKDWAAKIAPTLFYWNHLLESAQNEGGWITDERGRPSYQPDAADKIKMALGAKPLDKAVQEVENKYLRDVDAIQRKNRLHLIDELLDAVKKGDGEAVQKLSQEASDYGLDAKVIRHAEKMRSLPPEERLRQSLLKTTRATAEQRKEQP